MIAVCGIDCSSCELFAASTDERAAESLVEWFRREGWLKETEGAGEIRQRGPYCNGCHGDRCVQWTRDCWIRTCCVDEKRLGSCSGCGDFPCARLTEWAQKNPRYAQALSRLRSMQGKQQLESDESGAHHGPHNEKIAQGNGWPLP